MLPIKKHKGRQQFHGLRLFELVLGRKIGQVSVLEFE